MSSSLSALILAGATAVSSPVSPAAAAPAAPAAAAAPATGRPTLQAQIARARTVEPSSFRAVAEVLVHAEDARRKTSGRRTPTALRLRALGPKALLPMLELVGFARPREVPEGVLAASRLPLIEAIGMLRDPRSMPILGAELERTDLDFAAARTVTEAIGRLESDEAVRRITRALLTAQGERARGILAGMGACHRSAIAEALAVRLGSGPAGATTLAIVKSLGDVGSAWAWQTLAARGDEVATRRIAARALVDVYVRAPAARQAASDALMLVDDGATPALVAAARKGASKQDAAALDTLLDRFAHNPTHAR